MPKLTMPKGLTVVEQRNWAADNLPRGHYERARTEKVLEGEYKTCFQLEEHWKKLLHKKVSFSLPLWDSYRLAQTLCAALKVRPLKKIVVGLKNFTPGVAGYYSGREIHIYGVNNVPLMVLIHELAHHVVHMERLTGCHEKDFLWVEDLLFQTLILVLGL